MMESSHVEQFIFLKKNPNRNDSLLYAFKINLKFRFRFYYLIYTITKSEF